MSRSLYDGLQERSQIIPTCLHYKELLELASRLTGLSIETLRRGRGEYTYEEWARFFDMFC